MGIQHEKEKEKEKRKTNQATLIELLHYCTLLSFERVLVVFYHANPYWNGYANKDNYSCLLDGLLCNLHTWRHEDMAY